MLFEGPMWGVKQQHDVEGFTTKLFAQRVISFIEEQQDQSLYLHLVFNAVHSFTDQSPESDLKEYGLNGFADLASEEDYRDTM